MKDPERYLEELGLELASALDGDRRAALDPAHRRFVNYEIYFLADSAEAAEFDRGPHRFAGLVTDPVSWERFRPDAKSPRLDYAGRVYLFRTAPTRRQFFAMPDSFAVPRYRMRPMPDEGAQAAAAAPAETDG